MRRLSASFFRSRSFEEQPRAARRELPALVAPLFLFILTVFNSLPPLCYVQYRTVPYRRLQLLVSSLDYLAKLLGRIDTT
eukprot:scaffold64236_cov51-Attheya_sp.AAC.2